MLKCVVKDSYLKLLLAGSHINVRPPNHESLCLITRSRCVSRWLRKKTTDPNAKSTLRLLHGVKKIREFSLTGSEWMSTCLAFRTDPRSARWRAGVPRIPLRGVPSIRELGVPYISGELSSISLCATETIQKYLSETETITILIKCTQML